MNEAFDQTWRALSEEILADVNQWQASHPKATFQELEQAIHERISRLEAQALQEAALARTARDWSSGTRAGPSPLPGLWYAPARTRAARPPLARTGRARRDAAQKLWHLPHVWDGAFPPSMKS